MKKKTYLQQMKPWLVSSDREISSRSQTLNLNIILIIILAKNNKHKAVDCSQHKASFQRHNTLLSTALAPLAVALVQRNNLLHQVTVAMPVSSLATFNM
jgi:hypothetical protein